MTGPTESRHMKITVEVEIDVVDAALLEQAALVRLAGIEFAGDDDADAAAALSEEEESVRKGPEGALLALVDPYDLIPDASGVEVLGSTCGVQRVNEPPAAPDFDALFALCRCGDDKCWRCSGFQLTPRTARVLWGVAQVLADRPTPG